MDWDSTITAPQTKRVSQRIKKKNKIRFAQPISTSHVGSLVIEVNQFINILHKFSNLQVCFFYY